jgi:hypothetical protein
MLVILVDNSREIGYKIFPDYSRIYERFHFSMSGLHIAICLGMKSSLDNSLLKVSNTPPPREKSFNINYGD